MNEGIHKFVKIVNENHYSQRLSPKNFLLNIQHLSRMSKVAYSICLCIRFQN